MRLKFSVDPVHSVVRGAFHLAHRYGGPPARAHDGIVAAVVDEAMAKLNSLDKLGARISEMTVEYLHPVPLGRKITVEARSSDPKGREFSRECTICDSR
ncbi:MAG TPA: hotdog domain-containing protein, partial [Nitrospiria bacterium]